jgi:hypothetical protein
MYARGRAILLSRNIPWINGLTRLHFSYHSQMTIARLPCHYGYGLNRVKYRWLYISRL